MASVTVPGHVPWVVARWAFRGLLERTVAHVELSEDIVALERAAALDGLHLDLLEPAQAGRLGGAVRAGATTYRDELGRSPTIDLRDAELGTALTALIESLSTDHPAPGG